MCFSQMCFVQRFPNLGMRLNWYKDLETVITVQIKIIMTKLNYKSFDKKLLQSYRENPAYHDKKSETHRRTHTHTHTHYFPDNWGVTLLPPEVSES